jgi:hypothetical protein
MNFLGRKSLLPRIAPLPLLNQVKPLIQNTLRNFAFKFRGKSWDIELCEYLASQGFVVIASPSMGATSRSMTVDIPGANAEAQDISFLIDFAVKLPDTDASEVAVAG